MHKLKFSFLIIILTLITSNLFGYKMQVLNENQASLSISIQNSIKAILQKEILDSSITNIIIPKASYETIGKVSIPFWSYKLALPNTEKPTITLSNVVWEDSDIDTSNSKIISAFEDYQQYKIQDIGLASKTPTMFLSVYPVKYDRRIKKFRQIKSALINIRYTEPFKKEIQTKSDFSYLNGFSKNEFQYQASLQKLTKPSFASGKWYRIAISDQSGYDFNNEDEFDNIFKVTYDQLKDAGLTETSITKNRIFIYANANYGQMITEYNPTSLVEIPRSFFDNNSSSFISGDYMIFYGKSPTGQYINYVNEVDFLRNPYSFINYFWILVADSEGSPQEFEIAEKITTTPEYTITSTDYLWRKEKDNYNILDSGNDWFNKIFTGKGSNTSEYFALPSSDNNFPTELTVKLKSGSESGRQYFKINLNNNSLKDISTSYYGTYTLNTMTEFVPRTNTLRVDYYNGSGTAYIDYAQAEYEIEMQNISGKLIFYAPKETGNIKYIIDEDYVDSPRIFDISDKHNIIEIPIDHDGNEISFIEYNPPYDRRTYLLTSERNFSEITSISGIENPDFTSLYANKDAQYIIITDESLLSVAEKIATIHNSKVKSEDRLSTFITTQKDIMRQFNGDNNDSEAIRTFLKYAYNNWNVKPEFILILGDGTYDHRRIKSETKNLVNTYQVYSSDWGYYYYASDFRYTYLTEGDLIPDVAIGRVPVSNFEEAENFVEKLDDYLADPNFGTWRSKITLVADDPTRPRDDEWQFIDNSETFANSIFPNNFNINKIYLTEYPESQDESKYGVKKPAATEAIHKSLSEGTVLINYIGHGAPYQWTQEDAFSNAELPNISNRRKLPLWIAGTCTWGKYDEILNDCMPEQLLTMKADGAIACMGATRPTQNNHNFDLFSKVFTYWFANNKIQKIRAGSLLKQFVTGNSDNNEKYVLFGDPALYLAFPYNAADFDPLESDTLKALQNVKIQGTTGNENFSGKAIISLFDSKQNVTRYYTPLNSNEQKPISYKLPGDVLFKGNINIENGQFNSSFFIPKDLNYSNDFGKLHIYGWNDEDKTDFSGVYNSIVFSGSENIADSTGPKITLLKNNEDFFDGGLINSTDVFALRISDEHGINLTGKMGHTISLEFDDNKDIQNLTSSFTYDEGSDTSGIITIVLPEGFDHGEHYIMARAWDNANNSTAINLSFTFTKSEDFKISHIVNYPNPFRVETDITFYTSEPCDYSITIFTLNGLKIKEYKDMQSELNGYNQIHWNGEDDFGDQVARGTYIYKVNAKSISSNQKDSHIGKMVKS